MGWTAMTFQIRISKQAQSDIEEVLAWTLREFGERKYDEYRALLKQALIELAGDPESARRRPELHKSSRTFHIARRGKRARHFFLLRIADDGVVEIGRLLYDGMDLAEHLPPGYKTRSE